MAQFPLNFEERARELREQIKVKGLTKMVMDMGLFDTIHPDEVEKIGQRNYLLILMYDMGMIQDKIIEELIDKWLKMDYTVKEEHEDA